MFLPQDYDLMIDNLRRMPMAPFYWLSPADEILLERSHYQDDYRETLRAAELAWWERQKADSTPDGSATIR